jgi:hypothetical protein
MGEPKHRSPLSWHGQISAWLLGLTTGLGVNVLSDRTGLRGVAVAAAAAACLSAIDWIRRQPPGIRLVRWIPATAIALALTSILVAAAGPQSWSGPAILTSAALTLIAVLLRGDIDTAAATFYVVATVALGVAFIGIGVGVLLDERSILAGLPAIAVGVLLITLRLAYLTSRHTLVGAVISVLGVLGAALGLAALAHHVVLGGVSLIAAGVSCLGLGSAIMLASRAGHAVSAISLGLTQIGYGIVSLTHDQILAAALTIGLGTATIGIWVAHWTHSRLLSEASIYAGAVAFAIGGIAVLTDYQPLLGRLMIVVAAARISRQLATGRTAFRDRSHRIRAYLMQDPHAGHP